MKHVTLILGLVAALAIGCSKDGDDAKATGHKVTESGVSAVPASELGPNAQLEGKRIAVTTKSKDALSAFTVGRDLYENVRHLDSVEHFKQAIELDPEFAQAHAYLGMVTPGDEGLELLKQAVKLSQTLPPAEHLWVKSFLLQRTGRRDEHAAAVRKIAGLAPGDPRAHIAMAFQHQDDGDLDAAQKAYERAVELDPKIAPAYNYLAYLHANRGQLEQAVAAAKQYAELRPKEPNPHDSLGEITMMAGDFEKAEAAFARALEIEPSFTIAWEGVGMTKLYRGDVDGSIAAFEKLAEGAATTKQAHKAKKHIAWAQLSSGDLDAALATADGIEGASGKSLRIHLLMGKGKVDRAKKELDAHFAALEKKGDDARADLAWALVTKIELAVEMDAVGDAEELLTKLENDAAGLENEYIVFGLHYARGMVALGKDDGDAAVGHFDKIANPMVPYGLHAPWRKTQALEKAGKAEEAKALRIELSKTHRRSPMHAFLCGCVNS